MKKTKCWKILLPVLGFMIGSHAAMAENDTNRMQIDAMRAANDAEIKLVYLKVMGKVGDGFWALYDEYRAEKNKIDDEMYQLIFDYAEVYNAGSVSDEQSVKLLDRWFVIKQARLDLKREYRKKLKGLISDVQIGRFFQIDNKSELAEQLQVSSQVPLMN